MNHLFRHMTALFFGLILFGSAAIAEEFSLKQVVAAVLENHPDLNINRVDAEIAGTEMQRIEGTLDAIVTASIGASEEQVPTSSDFQAAETRTGQLSGAISKPLSSGGTIGANFNYSRTSQGFVSPLASQLARFNPAYRNQVNVTYRHPLLKGADRPDYHESLISAEAGVNQVEHQRRVIAQTLSLQALNAYYQLASDDINIHIAEQAVKRSRKLLSYQRSREQFGLIEKADRLQAEALLAARKTDLQRAIAKRLSDQNTLNRLMRRSSGAAINIPPADYVPADIPAIDDAIAQAENLRPELQVLKAQMQAANAQLNIARDSDQIQLDVVAELGTRALSASPGTTAARSFNVKDHYAAVSIELSDALGRNTANAAIRKAELQRQRIMAERISNMEQIISDISTAMTAITSGRPTLEVARKQVQAEQRKFNAEMRRYKEGRSDTATLVQFEGELRNASLNAELQQLTIELAEKQLSWAQGKLLYDLGLLQTATTETGNP